MRGANCALRDSACLRENLYQVFERTFTHADGICNAHPGMASRDILNDKIPAWAGSWETREGHCWRRPP